MVLRIATENDFARAVLQSAGWSAVCFCAAWCGDCRQFAPVFDKLANLYAATVDCAVVDISLCRELEEQWRIGKIPTVILFQAGQEVHRWVNEKRLDEYRRDFDSRLTP